MCGNGSKRTQVTGLFPNRASLLRLVGAMLMEITRKWRAEQGYLNRKAENETLALLQNRIYREKCCMIKLCPVRFHPVRWVYLR